MALERFVEAFPSKSWAFFFAAIRDLAVVVALPRIPERSSDAASSTNFRACSASLCSGPEGTGVTFFVAVAGTDFFLGSTPETVDFLTEGFFFVVAMNRLYTSISQDAIEESGC